MKKLMSNHRQTNNLISTKQLHVYTLNRLPSAAFFKVSEVRLCSRSLFYSLLVLSQLFSRDVTRKILFCAMVLSLEYLFDTSHDSNKDHCKHYPYREKCKPRLNDFKLKILPTCGKQQRQEK
jgi:hypothetical protein